MAAPKRTPFQREQDLEEITRLYLTGKTQAEIAGLIGVSRPQIQYDLETIRQRWRESSIINFTEAKQCELARLDELERAYWAAWEKSCGERRKTRQETSQEGQDSNRRLRVFVDNENLFGNPAYLAGVQYCISERCKILGLYAPAKIAPTTPDGEAPYDSGPLNSRIASLGARLRAATVPGRASADANGGTAS